MKNINLEDIKKGDILNISYKGLGNSYLSINLGYSSFINWKVTKLIKENEKLTGFYVKNNNMEEFLQLYNNHTLEPIIFDGDFLLLERENETQKMKRKMVKDGWFNGVWGFDGLEKVVNNIFSISIEEVNLNIKKIQVLKNGEHHSFIELTSPIKNYSDLKKFIELFHDIIISL